MSYLARIRTKSALPGTDKTDKTSSVSSVSTSQGVSPRKNDTRDDEAAFKQALAGAVAGLSITADELRAELSADDIHVWCPRQIGTDNLRAFAQSIQDGGDRQSGRIPAGYGHVATCKRCGPVWLFADEDVKSCPRRINRMAGWPIPRPGN